MSDKKFNFTKASISKIPAAEKRVFYYDATTRGLALLVEPTGRKTFYFYKKVGKTTKQLKIGTFPERTVEEAREQAHRLNAAVANKEDTSKVTGRKRGEDTFGDMFDKWLDEWAKPRRKTWEQDKAMFDLYLKGRISGMAVSAITVADVRRLHAELGHTRGERTANRVLEMVRAVFNHSIEDGTYKNPNPVLGVRMFERQSRVRRLMPNEFLAFLKAVEACPSPLIRDYVLMSLYTGQRQANVLMMRWEQIDFENRVWRIPMTKNGRSQEVPLEDAELEILHRRDKEKTPDCPWVFPSPRQSRAGHLMEPKKAWANILKEAGLTDFRIHDLRRSLGSLMVDAGASLPVIGRALGHQSHAATQIYARLSLDPVRQAKLKALALLPESGET